MVNVHFWPLGLAGAMVAGRAADLCNNIGVTFFTTHRALSHAGPENHKTFKNLKIDPISRYYYFCMLIVANMNIFTKIGMNFDVHTH